MRKAEIDYSLYLVTDSTPAILGSRDLVDVVRDALSGSGGGGGSGVGIGVVQLREKNCDSAQFIARARRLHEITRAYNVPLLINDRVDVALAVQCEGVHVGQDDMGKKDIPFSTYTMTAAKHLRGDDMEKLQT